MVKKNRSPVSSDSVSKVKVGLSLTPYSADRLNAIARKLDISRSELLERLAKGALDISRDKTEVTVTWKKSQGIAVDVAEVPEETASESAVNGAETAETQLEQPSLLQASYESLQQLLSERESAIAELNSQLAEKQNLEQQLHQQLSERENSLNSLLTQSAQEKQNLEQQLHESVSKSSYETLQQLLTERESAIDHFQVQLTKLQDIEHQLSQSAAKQRDYDALQQRSQEQLRTIKALQDKLAQQQAFAGIGEAYLNKWRRH